DHQFHAIFPQSGFLSIARVLLLSVGFPSGVYGFPVYFRFVLVLADQFFGGQQTFWAYDLLLSSRTLYQQCGDQPLGWPPQRDPIFRDAKVLLFWCDQQQKE